ncbi:MAG TPA: ATP-binding protein [Caulobacteraceae bacterium]|nr:ATP-binding protein [Caulobacteraceae bacterium]
MDQTWSPAALSLGRERYLEPLAVFAAACALLFCASWLAVQSSWLSGGVIVLWPADGLIVGLMLTPRNKRPWLVMTAGLLGVMLAFMAVNRQMTLGWTRVCLMSLTIPPIYLAIRRLIGQRSIADARILLPFMGICALVGAPTSVLRAYIIHQVWGFPFAEFALTTTSATFVGYAVITPLLLLMTQPRERSSAHLRAKLAMWAVVALYSVVMTAAFMETHYPTGYLIPLALILVAHAVDFTGIAVVILATALISVALTFHGYGPISHFPSDLRTKILMTQAYLAIIVCMTLPFSAIMTDRERLKRSLVAALEEAKAASHAKSTFLATVSHEIRTPLNGVLGMAQVMAMGELNPVQRERLAVVRSSGESLLSLLNDVLDLSKIEAGKLTLETIDYDLVKVIETVAAQNQALAANKGLTLVTVTDGAEGLFEGDPNRIRQVVQNLVSNAIKFTASGGVTITAAASDDGLKIQVRDTGMGIPADKVGTLFQKFSQVDESTTRKFGGTGLGLSICRELAQAMGGDVSVESRDGEGSTFTMALPLRRAAHQPVRSNTPEAAYRPPELGLRVLAAEDNPTNQLVLKTLLAAAGVVPTIVGNGAEAVAAWRDGGWDVILMDVQMPVMDGPTAVKHIREEEAETGRARTRIVALTANAMDHHVREYLEAGMDDYLAKPIAIEKLFAVLSHVQASIDQADDAATGTAA